MGAGAGIEAGEMEIQVDTRGGAQQLEAVRGECPESHAEYGVIVKAVQGGEREVAAPRAHAGVVEGLLETLNERGPGECEHQHGGGNRRAQEAELVRARAEHVAAGEDQHDDRDHQQGHHPAS